MNIDLTVAAYIFSEQKVLLIHHRKLDLWLPVGGHIDPNETPDGALRREISEEVGLEVDFVHASTLAVLGNTKKNLATPFHVNIHSVGNHDHVCFYYLCTARHADALVINHELKDSRWFRLEELDSDIVAPDVALVAKAAFKEMEKRTD